MTAVKTSSQLTRDARLWRYLSLDKLIDLLSTGELFFAPLSSLAEIDPFEGYLPAVAMEAHAGIFRPAVRDLESLMPVVEDHRRRANRESLPMSVTCYYEIWRTLRRRRGGSSKLLCAARL